MPDIFRRLTEPGARERMEEFLTHAADLLDGDDPPRTEMDQAYQQGYVQGMVDLATDYLNLPLRDAGDVLAYIRNLSNERSRP